jgi:hypothetical protein
MKNLIIIITLLISSSINLIAQKIVIPEDIQKTYNITDVYKYTKLGVQGIEAYGVGSGATLPWRKSFKNRGFLRRSGVTT